MVITLHWNGTTYEVNLAAPHCIAIPLKNGIEEQPNAFAAPLYRAEPQQDGTFIGAIPDGSPVNFFNVHVNPHGNGTHTECIGHIIDGDFTIHQILKETHTVAELISVFPTLDEAGNKVILRNTIEAMCCEVTTALIVRTLPNEATKKTTKYTGTNPPYFSEDAMRWMHERGIKHLLTDLPSVDPEIDGGALKAHKMFWQVPENPQPDRTITEMVFVDNSVGDGLYLLNIQIAPLALDVSPSRPLLFRMKPIK